MQLDLFGFTHLLLDEDGALIGVARDIEVIHEWMELGRVLLFEWPEGSPAEYRATAGYNRIEVSDASSDILQEARAELSFRHALV